RHPGADPPDRVQDPGEAPPPEPRPGPPRLPRLTPPDPAGRTLGRRHTWLLRGPDVHARPTPHLALARPRRACPADAEPGPAHGRTCTPGGLNAMPGAHAARVGAVARRTLPLGTSMIIRDLSRILIGQTVTDRM